jgi:hypothetical protein
LQPFDEVLNFVVAEVKRVAAGADRDETNRGTVVPNV